MPERGFEGHFAVQNVPTLQKQRLLLQLVPSQCVWLCVHQFPLQQTAFAYDFGVVWEVRVESKVGQLVIVMFQTEKKTGGSLHTTNEPVGIAF